MDSGLGPRNPCTPLSPTYQSSQLLTPRDLSRITIERSKYANYQRNSIQQTSPTSRIPGGKPIQYGQHPILVERDHPIEQLYTNTSLKLSAVRAHDQIVPRPLSSYSVLKKTVVQDFPAEHPYSSHKERFKVFPDTRREDDVTPAAKEITELPLCRVIDRAQFKGWRREEVTYYRPFSASIKVEDMERLRLASGTHKARHKRSPTYPFISPLRDSVDPTVGILPPVTPHTREGLSSVHKSLMRTSYQDHFQMYTPGCYTPNVLRIQDTPLVERNSGEGTNCYTPLTEEGYHDDKDDEEQTGQLYQSVQEEQFGPEGQKGQFGPEGPKEQIGLEKSREQFGPEGPRGQFGPEEPGGQFVMERSGEPNGLEGPGENIALDKPGEKFVPEGPHVQFVPEGPGDQKQQINSNEESDGEQLNGEECERNVCLDGSGEEDAGNDEAVKTSTSVSFGEELSHKKGQVHLPHIEQGPPSPSHPAPPTTSPILPPSLPRNILSSRRYAELCKCFSRSRAIEQFHKNYKDPLPDLRESSRDGRRHVINGYHAYFYH